MRLRGGGFVGQKDVDASSRHAWFGALSAAWPVARVHAFSEPDSYAAPVEQGGGAGRWFTGSPADGFGCDACHEGAPGADLSVVG